MKCKFCNHTVNPNHKVCNKCGKRIPTYLHKNGWIWVLPLLLTFILLGVFTSKADYKPNDPTLSATHPATLSKSNVLDPTQIPQEVSLTSGTFKVGKELVPGRYILTASKGMGSIFIYKENVPYIHEILTHPHNSDSTIGVTKIEATLEENDLIQISDLDQVIFSPVRPFLKTVLVSGYHVVGQDIPPGEYGVIVFKGSGSLMIYDTAYNMRYNKYITSQDSFNPENSLRITLSEGEIVKIAHIDQLELTLVY